MCPALVDEDEPLWFDHPGHHRSPSRPLELVTLWLDASPSFTAIG
jgi:hypothetical protein